MFKWPNGHQGRFAFRRFVMVSQKGRPHNLDIANRLSKSKGAESVLSASSGHRCDGMEQSLV